MLAEVSVKPSLLENNLLFLNCKAFLNIPTIKTVHKITTFVQNSSYKMLKIILKIKLKKG